MSSPRLPSTQVRERRLQREAQKAEQRRRLVEEQQLRAQQALVEAENLRPDLAVLVEKCGKSWHDAAFFQRASERRVLPIVGVCKTSSHLHIFSSSHLLIFASSQPHIFSSSHLLIFTSSHLILIFASAHLHILSSSHLLIFTSSHLHIFSSSHLLIFTPSHSLLPSCSLALLLSPSFLFLSWRRGAVPTRRHEMQPFRTKWGSIAKNWSEIAISGFPSQPFRT